jgi:hypothetical protein
MKAKGNQFAMLQVNDLTMMNLFQDADFSMVVLRDGISDMDIASVSGNAHGIRCERQ